MVERQVVVLDSYCEVEVAMIIMSCTLQNEFLLEVFSMLNQC